jgi:hypothetical protein
MSREDLLCSLLLYYLHKTASFHDITDAFLGPLDSVKWGKKYSNGGQVRIWNEMVVAHLKKLP